MERHSGERQAHNRRQAEAFDQAAPMFEQPIPAEVAARLAAIVTEAGLSPGCTVLDVGTGTGALLPHILERRPASVVACDLSAEMLRRAQARFGDRVRFLQTDVVDLPSEEGPFDAVFFNACFANLYDQRAAVQAAAAMLKPGGRLVVSHPMGRVFVCYLMDQDPTIVVGELPPTQRVFRLLLKDTGLTMVRFRDEPELYLAIATMKEP